MLASTSRVAYESLKERGALSDGQRRVMLFFHGQQPGASFTRAQIVQATRIPIQTTCGRCNELVKLGYLEELAPIACPVTGNPSHPLRIAQRKDTATAQPALKSATEDSMLAEPSVAAAAAGPNNPLAETGRVLPLVNDRTSSPGDHLDDKPAAGMIHMQGHTLTVVSERLVTSYHSKTGKPFSFVVCSVKEAA